MFAANGWFVIIVVYAVIALVIGALVYVAVRLAVTHALRAHTRWLEGRGGSSA